MKSSFLSYALGILTLVGTIGVASGGENSSNPDPGVTISGEVLPDKASIPGAVDVCRADSDEALQTAHPQREPLAFLGLGTTSKSFGTVGCARKCVKESELVWKACMQELEATEAACKERAAEAYAECMADC